MLLGSCLRQRLVFQTTKRLLRRSICQSVILPRNPLWKSFSTSRTEEEEPSSAIDDTVVKYSDEVLLYERRTPSNHDWLMKSGLLFSILHTGYWFWYTFDFVPLVNASPNEQLHADPFWGYFGIVFALAVNAGFLIYPKRLISKLTYRASDNKLLVYTHSLPFMRRDAFPSASFPVSTHVGRNRNYDKKIKYFKINVESEMGSHVVNELRDLRKYRHGLPLGPSWPKYILNVGGPIDIVEPDLLMEILVNPEYFQLNDDDQDDVSLSLTARQKRQKWRSKANKKPRRRRR